MSVKGMLSAVPIAELLEWAQASRKTGALELENDCFRKVVYFVNGLVAAIDSTEPSDSLSHQLHAAGLLSPDQSAAATRVSERTGRPVANVLHRTGAIEESCLEGALAHQAREALLALFLWPEGRFSFREDELPEQVTAAMTFEPQGILEEGARRRARADAQRAQLGSAQARFRLCGTPTLNSRRPEIDARIVQLLAEPRSVLSLRVEGLAAEHAVLDVLAALESQGVLALEAEKAAPARAGQAVAEELEQEARVEASQLLCVAATPAAGLAFAQRGHAEANRAAVVNGADRSEPEAVAVGLLERDPAAMATEACGREGSTPGAHVGAPTAVELLAAARREMERRAFERALELFRQAEAAEPEDSRIGSLRAGAEAVFCDAVYRTELPPASRPRLRDESLIPDAAPDSLAHTILSQVDGSRSVRDLVGLGLSREADTLRVLSELRRSGSIELDED